MYRQLAERDLLLPDADMREALHTAATAWMEAEVSGLLGASHYERTDDRRAYRNGYRTRSWQTQYGEIDLDIPKLRSGSYYPTLLESPEQSVLLLRDLIYAQLAGHGEPSHVALPETVEAVEAWISGWRSRPLPDWADQLHIETCEDDQTRYALASFPGTLIALNTAPRHVGLAYWTAFLRDLQKRGLQATDEVWVKSRDKSLKTAVRRTLPPAISTVFIEPALPENTPLAYLGTYAADASLQISTRNLVHIQRLLRRADDAIGIPLPLTA